MNTMKRLSLGFLLAIATLGTSAFALAETPAKSDRAHEGHGKGAHFKKADKNGDGFLTKDEVGERRWDRIKVADANQDGKISRPELKQARKDGKLPHGGKRANG